jgi:NADPH-dependent 2,4-dienoyl-CoA reductase/sulfur reductase-like enzyme
MPEQNLVVVGASLAGLRAAEAARKAGFTGTVTLVGAEEHLPYDRPPLSKAYLDPGPTPPDTTFRARSALDDAGIDLRLGTIATHLDPYEKAIHTSNGSLPYDIAVIATGSSARILPGTAAMTGVVTLRTLDDAVTVRAALDNRARTVVVGAGFIGSEVASGARKRGLNVTVVESLPVPLVRAIGTDMGRACADLHRRNGVDLRCGVGVEKVLGNGHVEAVQLSDGSTLEADLVVVGVGADPATEWLETSGITLDRGVVCDETMATTLPGVYAAGDVARWHNPLFETSMRLEHWTSAAEQGALAVRNALDPRAAKPYRTVPYFWSDWYDTRIQFVGVPEADEIRVVTGHLDDGQFVALYRRGDRVVGALALDHQSHIMKYRALIAKSASWEQALDYARTRPPKDATLDAGR